MRQVLSLSLPQNISKEVKDLAKKRGFTSISGYIKNLIENDKNLISEEELIDSITSARQEYKEGKTITGKSLADLL